MLPYRNKRYKLKCYLIMEDDIFMFSQFSNPEFQKIFKDLRCEEPRNTVLVPGLQQAPEKST